MKTAGNQRRPGWSRYTWKQLAAMVIGVAAMGFLSLREGALLIGARRFFGSYWLPEMASGAVVALAWPALGVWAVTRAVMTSRPWGRRLGWLLWLVLFGWLLAVLLGVQYFYHRRLNPAAMVAGPQPWLPPGVLLQLTWLAFSFTAVTAMGVFVILMLALPHALPRLSRRREPVPRAAAAGAPSAGAPPVLELPDLPARLRLVLPGGAGRWRPGLLRVAAGRLMWEPAGRAGGAAVDLLTATLLPNGPAERVSRAARRPLTVSRLDTPVGGVELKVSPSAFQLLQELARAASEPDGIGHPEPDEPPRGDAPA